MTIKNPITIGERFSRLVVLEVRPTKPGGSRVLVECDCGKQKEVRFSSLRCGDTQSCGCLCSQINKSRITHGFARHAGGTSKSKVYAAWTSMVSRCTKPSSQMYPNYGARGIKICPEWMQFEKFLADMGEPESRDLSLDRIDVDGDYTATNCRWASNIEQQNNKRNSVFIEHNGKRMTVAEWARELGLKVSTLRTRLGRGLPIYQALSTKVRLHRKMKNEAT